MNKTPIPIPNSKQMSRLLLFVITMLFLVAPKYATAQQVDPDGMTAWQVTKLKHAAEVAISSDGSHIAYTLSQPQNPLEKNAPAEYELYLLDTDSGDQKPMVMYNGSVSSIAFTPDGQGISFLSKRADDKTRKLYVLPLDGGEAQEALQFKTSIYSYDWAPDGEHIVFTAREPQPDNSKTVPYEPKIYEENLVHRRAYVSEAFGQMHEPHRLEVEGSVYQTKWSPDGQHIAVTAAPTPLTDDYYMHQRIKIVKFHDWGVVAEINNPGKIGEVTWSPDNETIAFISAKDINDPIDGRIMTAPASGGDPTLITEGYEGQFEDIAWSDDNTIRYLAARGVWSEYGEMRADGSRRKALVEEGGPVMHSFAISEKGRHTAFVGDSPEHPREVFYMGRRDKAPQRMTDNNEWLVNVKLADQEVAKWEARDGMELEGVLIKPLNYQEGQQYPMIMVVHGGPEAHESNGWKTGYSTLGQVAAAQGYAVFYPNYRGSTGYGVEFAKSSQADPAGKEFDDIADAADHFVNIGLADQDKIGVTGGSYGGYATGWLTTKYSDKFAAGVMFVGISNKVSKVGTTDIPDEEFLVHARKRPWDNWQFFLERSPIYHADNSNTPLLIMHGEEDPRVDVGQSYEMYRHLKLRGNAPVRLVLYPGEGHGNRNATARYDYNLRSLRWFNHYLMGEGGDKPPTDIEYQQKD